MDYGNQPFQLHPSVIVDFLFDIFLRCFSSYGAHGAIWVVAYDGWYFAVPSDVFLGWESVFELVTNIQLFETLLHLLTPWMTGTCPGSRKQ